MLVSRIVYEIAPAGEEWAISRDGETAAKYVTAEAAFEVVAAQASIEMRSDHEIVIAVRRPNKAGRPAAGGPVPKPV